MTNFLVFLSTFMTVFSLGFQSLNVNHGHMRAAFFTSFGVGVSNLFILKLVPQADTGDLALMASYLCGGPFGIITSMWVHQKLRERRERRSGIKESAGMPRLEAVSPEAGMPD